MYARISTDIWKDPAFTVLTGHEQWVFLLVLSQPNLGRDGTIPLTPRRWARYGSGNTREEIVTSLRRLAAAGFLAVDESLEEVRVLRHMPRLSGGPGHRPRPSRPNIPAHVRRTVYARDCGACVKCGATEDLALDHIHPWSKGGPDTVDNLQVLCRTCNSRKGARV